jgi:hypothetical protein
MEFMRFDVNPVNHIESNLVDGRRIVLNGPCGMNGGTAMSLMVIAGCIM